MFELLFFMIACVFVTKKPTSANVSVTDKTIHFGSVSKFPPAAVLACPFPSCLGQRPGVPSVNYNLRVSRPAHLSAKWRARGRDSEDLPRAPLRRGTGHEKIRNFLLCKGNPITPRRCDWNPLTERNRSRKNQKLPDV